MCPACWITGFISALFGGSLIAVINHPISWILSIVLIIYAIFKFFEAKNRGKKMTKKIKEKNKITIFRFLQGLVVGSISTIIIFYSLTYKEHQRMHDLLEKHGIEKHEH